MSLRLPKDLAWAGCDILGNLASGAEDQSCVTPGPEGVDGGYVGMTRSELWGKSSGERGTQRVGLSVCPLLQSADLHPCAKSLLSCPTLQPCGLWATRFLCPWGFFRQEYWSGLWCPPPGGLPDSGITPVPYIYLHWQPGSLPLVPPPSPPVFAGAQRNQTATLSSFSHRLYCLNIFNYDFFGQTLTLQKPTFHVAGSLHSPFDTTFSWRGISPNHKLPDCYRILIGFSPPTQYLFFFFLIWNLAVDSLLVLGLLHPHVRI